MTGDLSKHHRSPPTHICLNKRYRLDTPWTYFISAGCAIETERQIDSRMTETEYSATGERVAHQRQRNERIKLLIPYGGGISKF